MLGRRPAGSETTVAAPGSGPTTAGSEQTPTKKRAPLNPYVLGYAMGPAALIILLILRRFGVVAPEPVWLWVLVFVAIPVSSAACEILHRRNPTTLRLHVRVWQRARRLEFV